MADVVRPEQGTRFPEPWMASGWVKTIARTIGLRGASDAPSIADLGGRNVATHSCAGRVVEPRVVQFDGTAQDVHLGDMAQRSDNIDRTVSGHRSGGAQPSKPRGLADHRAGGRIGLALGSGAGRGWAHIGVLKALAKAGIQPDIVIGTSIGAVVGGCAVAGELDAIEQFARGLTRRSVLGFLDFNFSGAGLISGNKLVAELDTRLSHFDIERLATKFVAVATEIGTGQEIWLSRGRLVDAMRASYAMPGIFKPVEMGGRWLFDGALVNPVPVSVARALGARYIIAVNLNTDMSGRGSIAPIEIAGEASDPSRAAAQTDSPEPSGRLQRNGRSLRKLVQRQFFGEPHQGPSITTVMSEAMNIVQDRIARSRLAGDPPDAVIAPRLGDFGLFDFHRADALIKLGEQAAERALEDITREIAVRRACGILA